MRGSWWHGRHEISHRDVRRVFVDFLDGPIPLALELGYAFPPFDSPSSRSPHLKVSFKSRLHPSFAILTIPQDHWCSQTR